MLQFSIFFLPLTQPLFVTCLQLYSPKFWRTTYFGFSCKRGVLSALSLCRFVERYIIQSRLIWRINHWDHEVTWPANRGNIYYGMSSNYFDEAGKTRMFFVLLCWRNEDLTLVWIR